MLRYFSNPEVIKEGSVFITWVKIVKITPVFQLYIYSALYKHIDDPERLWNGHLQKGRVSLPFFFTEKNNQDIFNKRVTTIEDQIDGHNSKAILSKEKDIVYVVKTLKTHLERTSPNDKTNARGLGRCLGLL
jgi:hypothetical protein